MLNNTVVFRVEGMHCSSCTLLVDDTLEDLPGVSQSHTDLKSGRSTVQLDTTQTGPQQLVDTIAGLGYSASVQQRDSA